MTQAVLTIMRLFSTSLLAYGDKPDVSTQPMGLLCGVGAVLNATWLETPGASETLCSEVWKQKAPNIFVVTSLKNLPLKTTHDYSDGLQNSLACRFGLE